MVVEFRLLFYLKIHGKFSKIVRSIIKIPFNLINLFHKVTLNNFGNLTLPKYLRFVYFNYPFKNIAKVDDILINLSQSKYQYHVLNSKNIQSELLFDYIREDYFKAAKEISFENK